MTSKPNTNTKPNTKPNMAVYNKAVRTARTASAKLGGFNWTIGDLALTVATAYGDNTIKRFADDIGQEVTTVRNMRTASEAYPIGTARDLQSWTVYSVFASQEDRVALVTDGNDGNPWSVSAARALVKSRKDAGNPTPANGDESSESAPESGQVDQRAKLVSEVDRLRAELAKAEAALAKYDAENKPASDAKPSAKTSKPTERKHIVKGLPEHTSANPNPACSVCAKDARTNGATVTQIQATAAKTSTPRRSRTRVAA